MPTEVFITGATGYIGGSILDSLIAKSLDDVNITALLRSVTPEFTSRYGGVRIVTGTFDDFRTIETAASNAEIVIHAGDMDHPGCVNAILSGLDLRTQLRKSSFLLHLTGTGCISDERVNPWDGKLNPRVWNDIDDIKAIYDLPDDALHHKIDKQIMDASNDYLKTACICPSDVYGQNTGGGTRVSFMVPLYVTTALRTKEPFYLGAGENVKAVIHVVDVASLFILLLEHAIRGGGEAQWGREGFYFTVNDAEVQWKEAATAINSILVARGSLPKGTTAVSWTAEQVGTVLPHWPRIARYLWGSNTRAVAARAKKLGWKPTAKSFWDSLEEDVDVAVMKAEADANAKAKVRDSKA